MVDFEEFKQLLTLCYIIPTIILYGITLYIVFLSSAKTKFSTSFYSLFAFSAINYVVHAFCYFVLYRFTKVSLFFEFMKTWPSESFVYPIIYGTSFYTFFASHTYSLAISFNRFTIFILKTEYNSFWRKYNLPQNTCINKLCKKELYLKWILLFCVFGPLIFVWAFPFIGIQNKPIDGYGAYLVSTITNFAPWWQASRNSVIEIFITSMLSLGMNIYVIFSIFKRRYYDKSNTVHISPQDSALIPYTLLIFLTEIFNCIQQLLLVIDRTTFLSYVMNTQFIFVDISDLAPAWFILITNKQLRKEIFKLFHKSSSNSVVTIATPHYFYKSSSNAVSSIRITHS